jgi:hypothetical protein
MPPELAAQIRGDARDQFIERMISPIIIVRLEEPDGELASGLAKASTLNGSRLLPSLGFDTVVDDLPTSDRPSRRAGNPKTLAGQLAKGFHFAVPLRKRPASGSKPFAERISVGRALNNDIVLRHKSVSKFHAWFECDEDHGFYLADARSTNTTTVNAVLVGSGPVKLHDGDEVRFGEVATLFCLPGLLWDAAHAD